MPRNQSGMWFEEFEVGQVVEHAVTRTITESDNVFFTALTMNTQPMHLDADYSSRQEFRRPLVNSMFTVALVVGLSVYETTLGTTVANLGFEKVEFPHPLFHGDSVHVETEITATRESKSRPNVGIVTFEHRGFNQRDELVCTAVRTAMMRRRPSGTS